VQNLRYLDWSKNLGKKATGKLTGKGEMARLMNKLGKEEKKIGVKSTGYSNKKKHLDDAR